MGQRVGGRFQIERLLGAGSSGAVYDVQDERVGRHAALKVLWDQVDENSDAWQRLKREVMAAQAIRDPGVIAVHDMLIVEGHPALLMEQVEGSSLRDRILGAGPMAPDEAVRVIGEILHALALLHGAGIVHRDVKSGNVLIASGGQVKLGDFGLAQGEDLGATLTATGTTLGTPAYMAPEVIRGERAGPRSDLYAVGVILFEALAGRLPFDGASGMHVAHKHLSERPPFQLLKKRGTPAWLVEVTERLLDKDPQHRYASAEETLTAIEGHRAGSLAFRLARAVRRQGPALAGALSLAVCCVLLALWWRHGGQPLTLSYHDRVLEALTSSGKPAWSQTLPRAIQSACFGAFGPGGTPAAACAITWDEKANGDELSGDSASAVWVFDVKGKLLERIPLIAMGKGISPRYLVNLSSHRFGRGEPERLVVYARHYTWHPTALYVYSLKQRQPWELASQPDLTFLNSGSIPGWTYQDLNGDGRDDILCAGVNMPVFWADFTAGLKVGPPGEHQPYFTSPDRDMGLDTSPVFYRFFSFEPYVKLRMWREPSGRSLLGFGDQTPWPIGTDGALLKAGWTSPPDAKVALFNAALSRLTYLRDRGQWQELLLDSEKLPQGISETYDWVRRLYRACALVGTGREEAASTLALSGGSEDKPPYAYQVVVDSRFLEGKYETVRDFYDSLPESLRRGKPELGNTLLLSALYAGDGNAYRQTAESNQVFAYDWYPAMLLAAQQCLRGAPAAGERTIRAMGREKDQEAGPRLWLAECLLRQGKLEEAKRTLADAQRWRDEDPREFDETEAWIQWCSGTREPSLLQRFSALVEQARQEAHSSPRARAFLPLTLAREAAMVRESGSKAEAEKLLAESVHLAPSSWRRVLAQMPPAAAAMERGPK